MISIVKMNRMGIDSSTLKFLFEFEFDNSSTLPEKAFAVGSKTYLIANGSTAQNIITSTRYEYNNGKWVKLTTTSEDTTNTDKITDNGNYSFANNDSAGFNDVTVDVAGSTSFTREYMKVSSKIPNNARISSGTPYTTTLLVLDSQSGEYDISDFGAGDVYLVSPLVKLTGVAANSGSFLGVTFTPAENFDGFYNRNNQKYTLRGNSISAGDGKRYFIDFEDSPRLNPNIIKYTANYEFEIE